MDSGKVSAVDLARQLMDAYPLNHPDISPANFNCCGGNDETPQEHTLDCPYLARVCLYGLLAERDGLKEKLEDYETGNLPTWKGEHDLIKTVCDSLDTQNAELNAKIVDLKAKLEWMTRKRWALEGCIGDMKLSNILRISSSNDETIRKTHRELDTFFDSHIEHAGGITVYTTYGEKDYTYTPPCYIGGNQKGIKK